MPIDQSSIDALLAPIAGENPSGKNLRYDPRYDELKEARREDDVLPEGGLATARKLADWPRAITLARQFLEKETKDLQVAAWLTEALLRREGFGGFAAGLAIDRELIARFWDTCYPEWDEEDPELRAAPLEWLATKLDLPLRQGPIAPRGVSYLDYVVSRGVPSEKEAESSEEKQQIRDAAIADGKPKPEVVDGAVAAAPKAYYKTLVVDLDASIAALNALSRLVDERMGRDAPSFVKLSATLEEIRRFAGSVLAQKLVDDPDPVAEVSVGAYEPPSSWSAGEAGAGALPPEPASVADATNRIAVAARFLRKQDPTNPAPYLMLRGLRWGELRAPLDGHAGGIDPKLLEAPPTIVRSRLKTLLLDQKWDELLEQGEGVMASEHGRGWLDLQRYVLTACEHLGGEYENVASAIRAELRGLLADLPRIREMMLMDDTPTANAETQAWLATEGLTAGRRASDAAAAETSATADSDIGDQTASLEDGIAADDATSEPGGMSAGARRRAPAVMNGPDPAPRRDVFGLARAELARGRPNRAIELLTNELARERSPRGRFVRQTQIAYIMVHGGLEAAARPILENLVRTIEQRQLEEWEAGPLVAQPLALLCRVSAKLDGTNPADPSSEVYQRVCRLDPLQAIALQREPT